MKFGIVDQGSGSDGEAVQAFASLAETVGFESIWVPEHVVVPKHYTSAYPYSEDGHSPPGMEDMPDPLMWLSYAAAVTTKIKLATGILILPQRHPLYVAKEVATLDRLSGGRVILGVGIGWLKEEFEALEVPWKRRAKRLEESVSALRSLWADGTSEFAGEFYQWQALESRPKPIQADRVPIVCGGQVPAAARRAARFGDGYYPVSGTNLPELLDALHDECRQIGRDPAEIEITTTCRPSADEVKLLADQGVGRVIFGNAATGAELQRNMQELGSLIAQFSG